jgi:hypothetical protein
MSPEQANLFSGTDRAHSTPSRVAFQDVAFTVSRNTEVSKEEPKVPMDFTAIVAVRQRFGDSNVMDSAFPKGSEFPLEQEAPFVGQSKDYPFSCPKVDASQMAVLQFESLSVTAGGQYVFSPEFSGKRNIVRINGTDVPGGITNSPYVQAVERIWHFWKTHSLLVPANVLRDEGNILHIESIEIPISGGFTFDNFIIDNVIVLYKTRADGVLDPGVKP